MINMDKITASQAKQNFGQAIVRAQREPLGVQRHGKLVGAIVSPEWLAAHPAVDERRVARAAQQQVELARLMRHQRIGIELLSASASLRRGRLIAASREVDRWEAGRLCSEEYIQRWRAWLALPVRAMVQAMCSDAQGWGPAMRQNSPFTP